METLSFSHTYNGKKVGGVTQKTNFALNGSLSLDAAISLFSHFVLAVWEAEIQVTYKFIKKSKNENENENENCQTDAVGFGFTNTCTCADETEEEDD